MNAFTEDRVEVLGGGDLDDHFYIGNNEEPLLTRIDDIALRSGEFQRIPIRQIPTTQAEFAFKKNSDGSLSD